MSFGAARRRVQRTDAIVCFDFNPSKADVALPAYLMIMSEAVCMIESTLDSAVILPQFLLIYSIMESGSFSIFRHSIMRRAATLMFFLYQLDKGRAVAPSLLPRPGS